MTISTRARRLLASAFVVGFSLAPLMADATTQLSTSGAVARERGVDLAVSFVPRNGGSNIAPIEGELQFTALTDGSVVGVFRQEGTGDTFPLSGYRDGDRVFFDVETGTRFHVDATLTDQRYSSALFGNAHINRSDYAILTSPCQPIDGGVSTLCR